MKPSLYAHPFASFCQKVLIALYENGTDFTYRKIGPEDPAAMSELMALWPLKKFPVLVDAGHTYLESSIIIEHLAIRHPGAVQLIPKDPETALETRMLDRFFDNYVMTPMQRIVADFMRASPARASLDMLNNIWIPFKDDVEITQPEAIYRTRGRLERFRGCDNVLENMVITPDEKLASCCGLTFEHIPEMKIGDARRVRLREMYDGQLEDFLKIWIRVEGPEKIFDFATRKDPGLPFPDGATHPCQTCAALFLNPRVRAILAAHYLEKVPEVMFRYQMMRSLERRSDPSFAPASDGTPPAPAGGPPRVGFGS